ncbi:hypothetical protein ACIKT0_01710 [Hansschlegelia beijingensis]
MTPKQITDWPAGLRDAGMKARDAIDRSFDAVAQPIERDAPAAEDAG